MTSLQRFALTIAVAGIPLALAPSASASTQTICGGTPPAGWITTAITGTCRGPGSTSLIQRVITQYENLPSGSSLTVCGDRAPAGWVTTAISNSPCATVFSTSYLSRTIRKVQMIYATYTRLSNQDRDIFLNEFDPLPSWRESNNGRPHRMVFNGIWELPFGPRRAVLNQGPLSHIVGGWQIGVAWEAQPGPLLDFGNLFYYGDLANINTGTRTFDRWFNTDGFERAAARAPAAFHRRVFPTRIDGLRADHTNAWNSNVMRDFHVTERATFQVRLEALNLFNRTQFGAPVTNPIATNFGTVTVASQTNKRGLQLTARLTF